jgi:glycosyltransferase involved in cell wall biosynthesis
MASPQSPLVSIIMPAHNAARFIEKAIQSVLDQTYHNWELLIIDDASRDETPQIAQSFQDARIRYTPVERIGSPSGVRNVGLRMAQGELIAFLDADDFYNPDTLEKLSKPLFENPALTAVYGFAFYMDEDEAPLKQGTELIPLPTGGYVLPPDYRHTWERVVLCEISCLLSGLMLRRSTLDRVGLFNEALCGPEDFEFYVRLFLDNFDGVGVLPEYVYNYRVYAASLTKAPERCYQVLNSGLRIMDWLFNEVQLPVDLSHMRPYAFTHCYRYFARERLMNGQPALARKIALDGLKNPEVPPTVWIRQCLPIYLRSFMPTRVDQRLVSVKAALRGKYQRQAAIAAATAS